MSDDLVTCDGCGTPLADGGVDWFCPSKSCTFERDQARAYAKQWAEQRERAEYERLKAKFEPCHRIEASRPSEDEEYVPVGGEAERAEIAAWLRGEAKAANHGGVAISLIHAADAIERGDYKK